MATYVALIHKDADSDYGVSFPDLPGCVTGGSSIDEALSSAKEALAFHIEGMLEEGEEIPIPTSADAIDRGDACLIAAIDMPDTPNVLRVNITVPAITLRRIDQFAEQRGVTRSGLLLEAFQRWSAEVHSLQGRPEVPSVLPLPRARPPEPMHLMRTRFSRPDRPAADHDIKEATLSAIREAIEIRERISAKESEPGEGEFWEVLQRLVKKYGSVKAKK